MLNGMFAQQLTDQCKRTAAGKKCVTLIDMIPIEITRFLFVFLLIAFSRMQETVIIQKSKYLSLGSLKLDADHFYKPADSSHIKGQNKERIKGTCSL